MGNFALGMKAFFRVWGDNHFAEQVKQLLAGRTLTPAVPPPAPTPVAPPSEKAEPARSEALTLLSVLQREARFVDFIQEPIASYTDAQIGAAVRGVHQDCASVLERLFALAPLRSEAEGATVEVPAGADPAQFRFTGIVPEQPPFRGTLCHSGWKATRCELPQWTGRAESALVLAPCEVEIR